MATTGRTRLQLAWVSGTPDLFLPASGGGHNRSPRAIVQQQQRRSQGTPRRARCDCRASYTPQHVPLAVGDSVDFSSVSDCGHNPGCENMPRDTTPDEPSQRRNFGLAKHAPPKAPAANGKAAGATPAPRGEIDPKVGGSQHGSATGASNAKTQLVREVVAGCHHSCFAQRNRALELGLDNIFEIQGRRDNDILDVLGSAAHS